MVSNWAADAKWSIQDEFPALNLIIAIVDRYRPYSGPLSG